MKKLAIVIINWNSYEVTHTTILSLHNTSFKEYDIILIDNHSTDGSLEKLATNFKDITILKSNENLGFAGGNNIGIQYAIDHGYKYTMLLNNDVEVESNFLEPLIEQLEGNSQIGAVQSLIYFHHDRNLVWNAGSTFNAFLGICSTPDYNKKDPQHLLRLKEKKIDWITGCAFMVRTELLAQIGGLNHQFFIYYEDVDLSFRIKEAGYQLAYVPKSVIYHIAGVSHKSKEKTKEGFISPKVHYLNSRNRIWFLKKYIKSYAIPSVLLYHIFYFSAVSVYFMIKRRWQKLKAWNRGIKDGLLNKL
jgi:GT2 family glycosyltransferase